VEDQIEEQMEEQMEDLDDMDEMLIQEAFEE